MYSVVLHLGSNIGKRNENLSTAISHIEKIIGKVKLRSSTYKTAAWGLEDQADFHNMAIVIKTGLSPLSLLAATQEIEDRMGRQKIVHWGSRVIDIDIIFYENRILQIPRLNIPHAHMQDRNFVLIPLQEIIPQWQHPIFRKDINQVLQECSDELEVIKM